MSYPERMLLDRLNAVGENAPSLEEKCHVLEMLRASPDASSRLDRMLIQDRDRLRGALQEAETNLLEMKRLIDKLTAPPLQTGVYLRHLVEDATEARSARVLVSCANGRRVVSLADDVDLGSFALGDELLLTNDGVVLGKVPGNTPRLGEVAVFDRYTSDRRLVLKSHEDELIVEAAAELRSVKLENGDRVRWDRSGVAYEKIERTAGRNYFLDEVPNVGPEIVGGQQAALRTLLTALTTTLVAPETAAIYGLSGRRSILLVGPPGCGKTTMARVAAAEIARQSGCKCRFGVVKPGEFESEFVGASERAIRDCFRALRAAASDGMAVLFLDEVESCGRIRGSHVGHYSDKFLAALLAEMDGFSDRDGVAVICATNRKDLVDPALLERISDIELVVNRPDMRGAREIFEIHLPASLPFSPNGDLAAVTRGELIQHAVSRLYSPNTGNEVCVIKFRDGKTRRVAARELISGRVIAQVCKQTCQLGCRRDVETKVRGLRVEDIDEAVSDAIVRLSSQLTPRNAHAYLSDLPQDVDVVAVEPVAHRVKYAHRYLNVT